MSENFTGITFAKQKVAPSDDAIIRRAILPDGILTGCAISYSGSTLTMAAGQLLICGRQIRHPAAQNWAVVDATSGFARLLLTIDLTRTSTKEVFDQVVDTIEYAAAEDGFPDLEQTDINAAGTRYQVAACVVSLGTGGITGIVSQLPLSRAEGGGGLNFKVVDGLTQPSDPDENTIWVNTDTPITGYYFTAEQPENMADGEVWFSTGTSSAAAFNAARKNTVMVYPISAKQMVDGVLVDVTAKSWQNGEWVDWINTTYLYSPGNEHINITDGWSIPYRSGQYSSEVTLYKKTDGIIVAGKTESSPLSVDKNAMVGTSKKLDITHFKNLKMECRVYIHQWRDKCYMYLGAGSDINGDESKLTYKTEFANGISPEGQWVNKTVTVDISSAPGDNYVGIYLKPMGSSGGQLRLEILNVWVE